jgi:Fe-S-cluster containining protein
MYGSTIHAAEEDLARWRGEGREDIVAQVGEEGRLWVDPVSKEHIEACPYFLRTDRDSAKCLIHDTKPKVCREYPTPVHQLRCVRGIVFSS